MMRVGVSHLLARRARNFSAKVDPFGGQYLKDPTPNPERLVGKVAIITGASSGIGRETAILMAKSGADAVVCADMNVNGGEETADMVRQLGGRTQTSFIHCDVASPEQWESMVAQSEKLYGKVNVLFNNAGIMHGSDDNAETTDESTWDLTMNINVKGVFFGCKYGIPAIRRAGGGSIINTASFVGLRGAATPQLAYTSSKGAVLAMTRELAIIHAREGIRVNAMCPGPLRTKLLMDFLDTEEKMNRRLVHLPMGRFGEAREMAQAVAFLASDESSYITGTDFLVDGGLCAAYVTPE